MVPFPGTANGGAVLDYKAHLLYVALVEPDDQNPLTNDGVYWDIYILNTTNGASIYHAILPLRRWGTLVGSFIGSVINSNPTISSLSAPSNQNVTSLMFVTSIMASDPDVHERGIQSFCVIPNNNYNGKGKRQYNKHRKANLSTLIQTPGEMVTVPSDSFTPPSPWSKYQRLSYTNPGYTIIDDATFWAIGPKDNMITILKGYQLQILIDGT